MFDADLLFFSAAIVLSFAVGIWLVSIIIDDVSIVDSFWSVMIMIAGIGYFYSLLADQDHSLTDRHLIALILLLLWSFRLAVHIAARNWGEEEDSRYQEIRRNNEPYFKLKSLYIVFLLQAVLAVIVSLPFISVFNDDSALNIVDYLAIGLWLFGMFFETIGDYQLKRFKADESNKGKVLDTGLWRYTRHPNYFGEFCMWWAFYLFAVATGHFWSILSPILMSLLLLKVSGVSLLESTITERRPAYREYIERTNAFFPWFPASDSPSTQR